MPEGLTPKEAARLREILADIEAGRRIACFVWKFLAVIGGIAIGAATLFSSVESGLHYWVTKP